MIFACESVTPKRVRNVARPEPRRAEDGAACPPLDSGSCKRREASIRWFVDAHFARIYNDALGQGGTS